MENTTPKDTSRRRFNIMGFELIDFGVSTASAIFFAILFSSVGGESSLISIVVGGLVGYFIYFQTNTGWKKGQRKLRNIARNLFLSVLMAALLAVCAFVLFFIVPIYFLL